MVKPKVAIVLDCDLTFTEEFQQVPMIRDNLDNIKEAYNGKTRKVRMLQPKSKDDKQRLRTLNRRMFGGVRKLEGKFIGSKPVDDDFEVVEVELGPLEIETELDYFRLVDCWSMPHNGVGYAQQIINDIRAGVFKDLTIEKLFEYGKQVRLSPGIEGFIPALKEKWKDECDIEAYILSVGIYETIAGMPIASEFDDIFATPFIELDSNTVNAVQQVVTPFNKTRSIIHIAKGSIDKLNRRLKLDEYKIDYPCIITGGDSGSDLSQFAYSYKKGAHSMGFYKDGSQREYNNLKNNPLIFDRIKGILARNFSRNHPTWFAFNEVIRDILDAKNSGCTLNPQFIDILRKGKVGDDKVRVSLEEHIEACPKCRIAKSFYVVDPMQCSAYVSDDTN